VINVEKCENPTNFCMFAVSVSALPAHVLAILDALKMTCDLYRFVAFSYIISCLKTVLQVLICGIPPKPNPSYYFIVFKSVAG